MARPTHKVVQKIPKAGQAGKFFYPQVGAAWQNPSGTISIELNFFPGVKLMVVPVDTDTKEEGTDSKDPF